MHNEELIDYLQSCRQVLERSSAREQEEDSKGQAYLHFAPIHERLSLDAAEDLLNHHCRSPFAFSQTQKLQNDLLDFRPYFDAELNKKKITSICDFTIPVIEHLSSDLKTIFIQELKDIEQSRGVLNALLRLRNWAYFPNKNVGSKNRKRFATRYLKLVLARWSCLFEEYKKGEMYLFLSWCNKRTKKILTWRLKKKELLSPLPSTLPIYKDEAAAYIKYFLQMACTSQGVLKRQFAEMAIYLSLCLACARKYSRQLSPKEVLLVTNSSVSKIPQVISSKPIKDIREKSKGEHDSLVLTISDDFLADSELWPPVLAEKQESNYFDQYCKIFRINNLVMPISASLANAIQLMGEFSLSIKDVENRLREAFKVVGLSQSSGGISIKCFLNRYHYEKGEDHRILLEPKNKRKLRD